MTPDSVVRAWFKEVWDEGNEEAIDRLMAEGGVCHGLSSEGMCGPAEFKPYFRMIREALGDLEIQVLQTVTEGDRVAAQCHVVARKLGHAFGAPVTDRPVDFHGMAILRVKDGQIVEGWNSFDFLSLYQQLGLVQSPVVPA